MNSYRRSLCVFWNDWTYGSDWLSGRAHYTATL